MKILLRRGIDVVTDAFASLLARPARSTAMVAGIVLGVASATAAVLLADTQQAQIDKRFDLQRSAQAVVQAQAPPATGFDPTAVQDIAALPVVDAVGEVSIWKSTIRAAQTPVATPIGIPMVVLDPGGAAAINADVEAGLPMASLADSEPRAWAWIGVAAAKRLGIDPTQGATTVSLGGQTISVAGLVSVEGAYEYVNSAVIIGRPLAVNRFGAGENVRLVARVRPGSAPSVGAFMRVRADPSNSLQLADATPPDGEMLLNAVTTDLRAAGLAVGAFVGLVGMITVANTLTMAVTQRTRELGLRSAMGWSRRRIASLIIVESVLAGAVASVIGCGAGVAAPVAWSVYNSWQLIVDPGLAPSVILGGVLACIIGGLLPARRAASIAPITAMRD